METKTNLKDLRVISQLRDMVKENQKEIKDPKNGEITLIDSYSASMIITVYDKISKANQEKFLKLPLTEMVKKSLNCFS